MEEKKTNLRMMEAIQIDDNLENLVKSDAKTKILVKNNVDTKYNNYLEQEHFIPGLYIADDMDQVDQILKFNLINVL